MSIKHYGEIFENLEILEMTSDGKCIAKKDGLVVFVSHVAPGDVVDIKIIGKQKKFLEGVPVLFHQYSQDRVEPFCIHFGICGGCKWQHINYETQLFFKQKQVKDALDRIGKVQYPTIEPIVGSHKTRLYRNKLEYTFSNKRWFETHEVGDLKEHTNALGFHIPGRFDKVLDITECHLQENPSNNIRNALKEFALKNNIAFFDLKKQTGLLRNLIIRISSKNEIMVIVQFFYEDPQLIILVMDFLKISFPEIASLMYVVNGKGNDTFFDLDVKTYFGKDHIVEEMEGLQFRIGPKSFYQTNSQQAYTLYKIAREFADIKKSDIVYDLYTGTGTIANFVARQAQKVIGIEYVEMAVEDAKSNSGLNSINNTEFVSGDMAKILKKEFYNNHGKPDVIITDPPRAGMHLDVVASLLEIEAPTIVYVSCNPATQARDLQYLCEKYKITKVQPVDMFPQTHHVENVVKLELMHDLS